MTPLRQQMLDDMTVRGLSPGTQTNYVRAVEGLAKFYKRSPDQISDREVQAYLVHLSRHRGLTWSSCNVARQGIRFLFRTTLQRADTCFSPPCAKVPQKLPEVLNRDELHRLFTVVTNRKHRAMFMTAYSAGLRVSEVTRLKITDIDSQRMSLRIQQGKGGKDRYVPLSDRLLSELREYWRLERPREWLFPSRQTGQPVHCDVLSRLFIKAKEKAGIAKRGGMHSLRHTYATHMLEAGIDPCTLQRIMGHKSLRATTRYLHIARERITTAPSPLDSLDLPTSSAP